MISTSGISGAGLKKCMPTTRSGVDVAAAISVTESADVLVASTASGRQMRSSSAKSSCFGARSSTIASITRSQSAKSARSVVSERRADRGVARRLLELSFLHLAREEVRDPVARALAELERDLAADRLDAGFDAELRDARAHRAEPDDADLLDLLRHDDRAYRCSRGPRSAINAPATAMSERAAVRPTPRARKPIAGPLTTPPV